MVTVTVLVLALVLSAAGAAVGALVGAYIGRASAMDARVEPLRAAVAELVDRFEHTARRWSKRDRDSEAAEASDRQRKLQLIARKVADRHPWRKS